MTESAYPAGTAPIKSEFLLPTSTTQEVVDDDTAERATSHLTGSSRDIEGIDNRDEGAEEDESGGGSKRLTPAQRRKLSKEEKKKRSGANKGRRFGKMRDEVELCWKVAVGKNCEFGDKCRFTHDMNTYLEQKPRDVVFPKNVNDISSTSPLSILDREPEVSTQSPGLPPSIDPNARCPVFEEQGECRHGLKCRFLGAHVRRLEDGTLELVKDDEKVARRKIETTELNYLSLDALKLVRAKKYPRPITDAYTRELQANGETTKEDPAEDVQIVTDESLVNGHGTSTTERSSHEDISMAQADTPDVPMRFNEKKRLRWGGLTYLAPLTTVGNLPFRRLCVSLGADITCGEMGLATSFLQGSKEEWSLVRRHPFERNFGIQLAGNRPGVLTATSEIIQREFSGGGGVDFVDLNCGCPIDLVVQKGSGSALLDAPGKLGKILVGMNKALGDIPLTVKLRTGMREKQNSAHKLMPRLGAEWGISAATLHGRSRQQRYTKLADWDYINECVEAVRAREEEEDLPRMPIFGGGDCYSSEAYWSCVEESGVDGVMVARGALIKPWIFTEIKERREWDISARERLELIRQYAEYGLSHFGSDTAGVNTTRRYLCEALSFTHRYIPLGLLAVLPGKLNDRPPAFRGRDELETLLASPDSRDWVRISEMFLGKPPGSWSFIPKHKSNAYGAEEGQG